MTTTLDHLKDYIPDLQVKARTFKCELIDVKTGNVLFSASKDACNAIKLEIEKHFELGKSIGYSEGISWARQKLNESKI